MFEKRHGKNQNVFILYLPVPKEFLLGQQASGNQNHTGSACSAWAARSADTQTNSSSFHVFDSLSTQVMSKANQAMLLEAGEVVESMWTNLHSAPIPTSHQLEDLDLVNFSSLSSVKWG